MKPSGPRGPHQGVFAAVFVQSPRRLSVSLSIPLNRALRTCSVDRRDLLSVITALIQSFFASVSDALCRLGSVTFLSKALSLWFACLL